MEAPQLIGAAGDWHGNTRWALSAVEQMCDRLAGEPRKIILHAGDYGFWDDVAGRNYLLQVTAMLDIRDAEIWAIDGNHESHPFLSRHIAGEETQVQITPRIWWLRRGHRWQWHGRTWLALGGAVSPDHAVRTEGIDWFPEEAITWRQAENVTADGAADVMLTHDAPARVPVRYLPNPPSWWANEDLARGAAHRELLQDVTESVQPRYLIHGHYHFGGPWWQSVQMPYGQLKCASLDMDGTQGNWGILNIAAMDWVHTPGEVRYMHRAVQGRSHAR